MKKALNGTGWFFYIKAKIKLLNKLCNFLRNQMALTYDHQLTYEKTPSYFSFRDAPKRVFDFNPKMKLIVIIRDPVIRIISQFVQYTVRNRFKIKEQKDFNETVEFEKKVLELNGSVSHRDGDAMIAPGRYVDHYKRWLEYFPQDQILILNGENFIANPYEEIMKVEKFLNLKPFFQRDVSFFTEQIKSLY